VSAAGHARYGERRKARSMLGFLPALPYRRRMRHHASRSLLLALLLAGSLPLGGCVAGLAMGAAGAAVRAVSPQRSDVTEDRRAAALAACQARAGAPERTHVIDVEQRGDGHVTVWGTIQDDGGRRAFECRYDGKIVGFKLRTLAGS
jgi:hypothetical protein